MHIAGASANRLHFSLSQMDLWFTSSSLRPRPTCTLLGQVGAAHSGTVNTAEHMALVPALDWTSENSTTTRMLSVSPRHRESHLEVDLFTLARPASTVHRGPFYHYICSAVCINLHRSLLHILTSCCHAIIVEIPVIIRSYVHTLASCTSTGAGLITTSNPAVSFDP